MHFFEVIFGISPDNGSGLCELSVAVTLTVLCGLVLLRRLSVRFRRP